MPDQPTTPDEIAVETALPGLELPDYHGKTPTGMKTSISGTGNRIQTSHEIGSTVVLLIEAKVKGSGHEETDDGILYVEKMKTVDLFEIPGAQGKRLASAVRSAYRTAKEGEAPLPVDPGDVVKTDASGVVITPADALGIEGDSLVKALTDESMTPVVVLYSDGVRELWPDEFDAGDPRPTIGTEVVDETTNETSVIVKILHGETGETLEEWTDEQENERLLRKENALERAEALERFETLKRQFDRNEIADEDRDEYAELYHRFLEEAKADREVMEEIRPEGAVGDPTPVEQVDPPEANEGLDGDPEETFPGYAGDAPDEEIEVEDDDDPDAEVIDLTVPGPDDFLAVDRDIDDLKTWVADTDDRAVLARWLKAEEQGRGRGLKPRKGALEAIEKRMAALFSDLDNVGAPDPTADGFEVPEGAEATDDGEA